MVGNNTKISYYNLEFCTYTFSNVIGKIWSIIKYDIDMKYVLLSGDWIDVGLPKRMKKVFQNSK